MKIIWFILKLIYSGKRKQRLHYKNHGCVSYLLMSHEIDVKICMLFPIEVRENNIRKSTS